MLPVLLVAGALGANLAFLGLGWTFGYPDVLADPPDLVLAAAHRPVVLLLFGLLAVSAALLAPIAVLLGRTARGHGRAIAVVGTAAAAVQVVGLLRWPLVVPFLGPADVDTFATLNTVLGTVVGETLGYAGTAAFTVLVVRAFPGRVTTPLGLVSAALVACGVLVPLHVPGADLANFAGYVAWSAWLVALAVTRRAAPGRRTRHSRRRAAQRDSSLRLDMRSLRSTAAAWVSTVRPEIDSRVPISLYV